MSRRIRSKAILKVVGLAVFAAMFCVGCGDKDTGGSGEATYSTITLDADGGKVEPKSVTATRLPHHNWAAVSLPTPTRDGYAFHGWYTAKGGHGNEITTSVLCGQVGENVPCGDATIYAHWTLNHYRITFDAHGGEVTPAYDATGDDWRLASLPTPTRDAYHNFDGWYTAPIDGTGEKIDASHEYTANTTLYAHWIYTGVHYTITFDVNGGGTVDPAKEETDAGGILQDLPTPERDGYFFIGWFTEKSGGAEVTTSSVFSEAATIYARWVEITSKMYKVTFNPHGGTVSPAFGITGEDGKLLTTLPTPKYDGHAFQGWFTEDGAVSAGTVFKANTTIHATWAIIHYTITFNAAGGTLSPTTAQTGSHWELTDLPTPTRDGYTFRGWFTAETGGTQVTTHTPLMGNTTIYAHWSLNDDHFTITFDANGGEVSPASVATGDGYRLASLPVPTRDGYVFHGWYTAVTGEIHVTGFTVFESDATVYAHWVPIVNGGAVSHGGEMYQTVVIGTQTWFARNLNYAVEGSKCYGQDGVVSVEVIEGNNHSMHEVTLSDADVQAYCGKYGRLYDWDAAMSVCPAGWHLPTDDEWATLIDFVGGYTVAGLELRSSSDWEHHGDIVVGADDYGFSALPGGQGGVLSSGLSYRMGDGWGGFWWSSTESGISNVWTRQVFYHEEIMRVGQWQKSNLHSVRCVKD